MDETTNSAPNPIDKDPKDKDPKDEKEISDSDKPQSENIEPEIVTEEEPAQKTETIDSTPLNRPLGRLGGLLAGGPPSPSTLIFAFALFLLLLFALFKFWPRPQEPKLEITETEALQLEPENATAPDENNASQTDSLHQQQPENVNAVNVSNTDRRPAPDTPTMDKSAPANDLLKATPPPPNTNPEPVENETEKNRLQQSAKEAAAERLRKRREERAARIEEAVKQSEEEKAQIQQNQTVQDNVTDTAIIENAITPNRATLPRTTPPSSSPNEDKIFNQPLDQQIKRDIPPSSTEKEQEILRAQSQEIEALKRQLAEAEQQRAAEAEARIAQLEAQLQKIENGALSETNRKVAMTLALDQLEKKILRGDPFQDELAVFRRFADDPKALSALSPLAKQGVSDIGTLQRSFSAAAREALAATRRARSRGALSGIGTSLSNLFNVRKVGDVSGDTPSAIFARAEMRLQENDLESALAELDKLPPIALETISPWYEKAQQRQQALDEIETLQQQILRDLQ